MRRSNAERGVRQLHREDGYVLLSLLLFMALLAIAAGVVARDLAFELRRDREEELLHRGVAYARAIRLYSSKTGRYPARPEDLLGTTDMRYLRKAYKDPITGKDFRFLHMSDVQPQPAPQADQNGAASNSQTTNSPTSSNMTGNGPSDQTSQSPNGSSPTNAVATSSDNAAAGSQPGLLIFGVASTSKARTIREFNHKDHYNDWLFYSIPATNQGFERLAPTPNPTIPQAQPAQSAPGQ